MMKIERAIGCAGVSTAALIIASSRVAGGSVTEQSLLPYGPLSQFHWTATPDFDGAEAIIYRSADGHRIAAAFRSAGRYTFRYPFDEFVIITSGRTIASVRGGDIIALSTGDVAYFREGTIVDFAASRDYSDVAMLIADHEVKWR